MRFALALMLLAWFGSGQQLPYKVDGHAVWAIQSNGTTVVETQVSRVGLEVSIHARAIPAGPECGGSKCSVTDQIEARLGGKPLWVGRYQIAGLGDLHYLAVSGSPSRLDLILMGGDAAESYEAHLIFNREHVVERILYPGMDLRHPFEVSHYFYGNIY